MTTKRVCLYLSIVNFFPYFLTGDSVYILTASLFFCTWNILSTMDRTTNSINQES